jgi:hypothetical protein
MWKTTTKEDGEATCGHDLKRVTFTDRLSMVATQQEILHGLMQWTINKASLGLFLKFILFVSSLHPRTQVLFGFSCIAFILQNK